MMMRKRQKLRKWRLFCKLESLLLCVVGLLGVFIVAANILLFQQQVAMAENDSHSAAKLLSTTENPLFEILRLARVQVTPDMKRRLPSWQQVVDRFGNEPKIVGLEQCQQYRQQVPQTNRMIAPAGAFNSGIVHY